MLNLEPLHANFIVEESTRLQVLGLFTLVLRESKRTKKPLRLMWSDESFFLQLLSYTTSANWGTYFPEYIYIYIHVIKKNYKTELDNTN